jgi:hypothetical protein
MPILTPTKEMKELINHLRMGLRARSDFEKIVVQPFICDVRERSLAKKICYYSDFIPMVKLKLFRFHAKIQTATFFLANSRPPRDPNSTSQLSKKVQRIPPFTLDNNLLLQTGLESLCMQCMKPSISLALAHASVA